MAHWKRSQYRYIFEKSLQQEKRGNKHSLKLCYTISTKSYMCVWYCVWETDWKLRHVNATRVLIIKKVEH